MAVYAHIHAVEKWIKYMETWSNSANCVINRKLRVYLIYLVANFYTTVELIGTLLRIRNIGVTEFFAAGCTSDFLKC